MKPAQVNFSAAARWQLANRRLIEKAIGELCYEQALQPVPEGEARWRIDLPAASWRFSARRTVWDFLPVLPGSVQRCTGDDGPDAADDAAQFFIDAAATLGMREITLGVFLEELANTLAADVALLQRREGVDAAQLATLPDLALQALLDGHPKALLNKGRIGWGADAHAAYGTESAQPVQLYWLAVQRRALRHAHAGDWPPARLLSEAMNATERYRFERRWRERGLDDGWLALPVHPWQWQQHVRQHYAGEIVAERIVPLGAFGDEYLPQQSLRTLAHATRPEALHLKLPLTVLNTSCYRGIPGRYIEAGPALSDWLRARCAEDGVLSARGTQVLREVAGLFYPHPHYEQIPGSPYRYREMLGAIWRESPAAQTAPGERPLLLAALLQKDDGGHAVLTALVRRSGLSLEDWLLRLFDVVVVPLYHLMCRYGVGLVAHAQNLCLILRDDAPARVALKDLQGDLRLVDQDFPELDSLPPAVRSVLTRLPPAHLLHDLVTGHFVTVLRFLSALLREDCGFPEARFYALLASVLRAYQRSQPQLAARHALFDLFRPRLERICINRVRFAIGYADDAQRPLPLLGGALENPLALHDPDPLALAPSSP